MSFHSLVIHNSTYLDERARRYISDFDIDLQKIRNTWTDHDSFIKAVETKIIGRYEKLFSSFEIRENSFEWLGKPTYFHSSYWASNMFTNSRTGIKIYKKRGSIALPLIAFDAETLQSDTYPEQTAEFLFGVTLHFLLKHAKKIGDSVFASKINNELVRYDLLDCMKVFPVVPRITKAERTTDVTITFTIGEEPLGSEEEYSIRHDIEEQLDVFLQAENLGEVEGGSIGGGIMEVHIALKGTLKNAKPRIVSFLAEHGFPMPLSITKDE